MCTHTTTLFPYHHCRITCIYDGYSHAIPPIVHLTEGFTCGTLTVYTVCICVSNLPLHSPFAQPYLIQRAVTTLPLVQQ